MAKPPRAFRNAAAFRTSLEERLRQAAEKEGRNLQRLRRQVAFDRLLARLLAPARSAWVLKGGYALELRLRQARATRDIDLARRGGEWGKEAALAELRDAASEDPGDFFTFRISDPVMDLEGPPEGGARFPVEAALDGRSFVKFHLDLVQGGPLLEPLEWLEEGGWLAFAGIPTAKFPAVRREQHFAEKLHAYTRVPPGRENTRVKDLVDLLLLIQGRPLDPARLKQALSLAFSDRPLPPDLAAPPASWAAPFAAMAAECALEADCAGAFKAVRDCCVKKGLLG